MAYNQDLPVDNTADIRENFRALKEDKIVAANTANTADSASKLENAHTINGVAFDGTADIMISASVPVGTIIAWASLTLPGGNDEGKWLACNGQSTDGYPDLAAIVGSTVPDYQGVFLRGYGNQISTDSFGTVTHQSESLGTLQGDAIRNITGRFYGESRFSTLSGAFYSTNEGDGGYNGAGLGPTNGGFDTSLVVPTANENRPINKAVLYLIKAK